MDNLEIILKKKKKGGGGVSGGWFLAKFKQSFQYKVSFYGTPKSVASFSSIFKIIKFYFSEWG